MSIITLVGSDTARLILPILPLATMAAFALVLLSGEFKMDVEKK